MKKYDNLNPNIAAFLTKLAEQNGPPLYALTPEQARKALDDLQAPIVNTVPALIDDKVIPGKITKTIAIRIIRPKDSTGILPVIMFVHGAGWILGNKNTHDLLARKLAIAAQAAVILVEYALSPEAHYLVAIEQVYEATAYIMENGNNLMLDTNRIAVAGDSVGGCMATVVAQLCKERSGPNIIYQALLYPVTDANFDTPSYTAFAEDYWLTKKAMEWFWDAYAPDKAQRKERYASPLQSTIEQLKGLPPALVITNENDVLRDEGEAYARKLMQADVQVSAVRILGSIHDIALLAPLKDTPQAKLAIDIAGFELHKAFNTK